MACSEVSAEGNKKVIQPSSILSTRQLHWKMIWQTVIWDFPCARYHSSTLANISLIYPQNKARRHVVSFTDKKTEAQSKLAYGHTASGGSDRKMPLEAVLPLWSHKQSAFPPAPRLLNFHPLTFPCSHLPHLSESSLLHFPIPLMGGVLLVKLLCSSFLCKAIFDHYLWSPPKNW